jgi:hypothetical protein
MPTPAPASLPEPEAGFRPRRLLFITLSLLWFFPTVGATLILYRTRSGPDAGPLTVETLRRIPVEKWCAIAIVLLQLCFVAGAVYHHFNEPSQSLKK